eukprot:5906962-Pyramimonas_sp.AAC.1
MPMLAKACYQGHGSSFSAQEPTAHGNECVGADIEEGASDEVRSTCRGPKLSGRRWTSWRPDMTLH